MPRNQYRFVLAACLATLAGASFGQDNMVKFTSSDALLTGPSPEAGLASCQPLRGDLAEVTGAGQKAYGTEVLPLRIVSGRCAGNSGWAGTARFEVAGVPAAPTSNNTVQFSSADSLYDALTPKSVKASCQPLRGDGAQVLDVSRFAGTDVYRVAVLSGHCQGSTGWVGAARIERAASVRSQ